MISDNYQKLSANGTGSLIRVNISWDFVNNSELNCWVLNNTTGAYKFHRLGEITIDIAADKTYVDIQNPWAPTEATAFVARVTPVEQTYDLINGRSLDPEALESALDKAIKLIQELQKAKVLGEQQYITSIDPFEIVSAVEREETLIYFDSNGDATYIHPSLLPGYYKVKVSSNDTTPDFLENKLSVAQFGTINDGGDEYISIKPAGLSISNTSGLQDALDDLQADILQRVKLDLKSYTEKTNLDPLDKFYIDGEGAEDGPRRVTLNSISEHLVTGSSSYRAYFDNSTLSGNYYVIPHNLNRDSVSVTIFDNENKQIVPDEVIDDPLELNAVSADLSSFIPLSGTWRTLVVAGGGSVAGDGEANTVTNVGSGVQLVKGKVGIDIPVRTLQSSDGTITFTQNANDIDLAASISDIGDLDFSTISGFSASEEQVISHVSGTSEPLWQDSINAEDITNYSIATDQVLGHLSGTNRWLNTSDLGSVTKVGTPVANQIAVWTGDGTLEGEANLTYNGTSLRLVKRLDLDSDATTPPLNIVERSAAPTSPSSGDIYLDDGTNTGSGSPGFRRWTGTVWEDIGALSTPNPTESIIIACSDEVSDLTSGTTKTTFRMPYAFTLSDVRASVATPPSGSNVTVDINENGSSILSTKLSIDAGEKTSTTAATPAVISDSSLADDAEMTIDIDAVGSATPGTGLKVTLIGTQT